jgi:hypothetical protein
MNPGRKKTLLRSVLFNDVIDNKFGHLGSESFNHKITKNKNLVNLIGIKPNDFIF